MLTGYRVLGFDLETTGFNYRSDRIVQFAFIGSDADGSHINLQSRSEEHTSELQSQ